MNRALVDGLNRGGVAMISSTELRGRTALRMCTINPRTSEDDIRSTVELLRELADRLSTEGDTGMTRR
jgi:hypothetical protein